MKAKDIIIGILICIVLVISVRYIFFKKHFDEWSQGLERIEEWEKKYREDHPNATDKEVEAAFKSGIADITLWKEQYKQENPGATDSDADAAFKALWN